MVNQCFRPLTLMASFFMNDIKTPDAVDIIPVVMGIQPQNIRWCCVSTFYEIRLSIALCVAFVILVSVGFIHSHIP